MANVPRIEVIKQTALQEDRATKNGATMSVYVVVKNSPFQLVLGLKGNKQSFNQLAFDMKLLYDMEAEKEVAFLKTKPIDYKPAINDLGDQITFDVKIKVLSSHHEDNFFRLKTIVWDPINPDHQLTALSYPIKVISKPLKHRKAASPSNGKADLDGEVAPTKQVKRTFSERVEPSVDSEEVGMINAKLGELLEEQQQTREEIRMMRQLFQQQQQQFSIAAQLQSMANPVATVISTHSADMVDYMPPAKKIKQEEDPMNQDRDIEGMMSRMLQAYSVMEFDDKTERVRSLLRNMSARDAEQLVELIDLLNAHGLQHEAQKSMYGMGQPFTMAGAAMPTMPPGMPPPGILPQPVPHAHPNGHACGADCPHKVELSRMDQFYSEVFF